MNIAIFASGKGTNFSAILKATKNGQIKARIALLVCDNPKAGVIARAKAARVKTMVIRREGFPSKKDFEARIIMHLKKNKINLIALAGFMCILSHDFVKKYKYRIMNIHPALLPSFKGENGIRDAYNYGVKVSGVTVHFVDEKVDHGPIILQEAVKIEEGMNVAKLEKKIHAIEHKLYPLAIQLYVDKKLKIAGRRVRIV